MTSLIFIWIGGFCMGMAVGLFIGKVYKKNKDMDFNWLNQRNRIDSDTRQKSLEWWDSLSQSEKRKLEKDFFDDDDGGAITDIDIEAMYRTYANK